MKNQRGLLLSLLLFAFFLSMSFASALTLLPGDSSTLSNMIQINATGGNITNCTFYAKSVSTANSTYVLLGDFSNFTYQNTVNGTFNSSVLEDSNDYILFANCTNTTNTVSSATTSSIIVDNTDPSAPTSVDPASGSTDTDGSITFSASVTGSKTTLCWLYFNGRNPGFSNYSMTHSANTCTSSAITAIPAETYEYYIVASDGNDIATSAYTKTSVEIHTGGGYMPTQSKDLTQVSETKSISIGGFDFHPAWLIIVGIAVLFVLYALFKK